MHNIAKKHTIKVNLLDNKDDNFENKVENLEVKNKNDINIFITNLYSIAVIIVYKY